MNLNDLKSKLGKSTGNTNLLLILLLTILFIIAALFIYRRSVSSNINKKYVTNNEFSNKPANGPTTADIYFFYTEWCPHCKTAKPVWADFKAQMSDKQINGITLIFHEVDCDKDTALAEKFNVQGYPTIKLVRGNQVIEYDAKPNKDNLMEFLNTSL